MLSDVDFALVYSCAEVWALLYTREQEPPNANRTGSLSLPLSKVQPVVFPGEVHATERRNHLESLPNHVT